MAQIEPGVFQTDIATNQQWAYLNRLANVTPFTIDDVEMKEGSAIYQQVLNDPIVGSSIDYQKSLVTLRGYQIEAKFKADTNVSPNELDAIGKSDDLREFVSWNIRQMDGSMIELIEELLDCVSFGYSIAEINYQIIESGQYTGKIGIESIIPKPRTHVRFVTNDANRILGFLIKRTNESWMEYDEYDPVNSPNFAPKAKFLWVTNRPLFGNPKGRSDLRRVIADYEWKRRNRVEWFRAIQIHGSPKLIALIKFDPTNPESRFTYKTDSTGTVVMEAGIPVKVSRVSAAASALQNAKNSSAGALEADSLEQVEMKSNGEIFIEAERVANANIATAILGANRATQEAKNGSRADSNTASDVVKCKTTRLKLKIEEAINERLIRPLILMNYGEEMLEFAPEFRFVASQFDSMLEGAEFAQKVGFRADESQLQLIDEMIGLPKRDQDAIDFREAQRQENERLAISQIQNLPGR